MEGINLIDIAIIAVIGLSVAYGIYSGLLSSVMNIAGLLVAWVCAFLMYSSLSQWIIENTQLLQQIVHYTEGASNITSLETARTLVSSVSESFVAQAVRDANFPWPFNNMLYENIVGQVYISQGLLTFEDYFNYTLAYAALNIISFLLILFTVYLLFSMLSVLVGYVMKLPVLRQFDSLLGGGFGLIRGVFIVFVVFMLVPVVLAVVPVDIVQEMIDESRLASFFYEGNFILSAIKSVL
ncbi:MAG: CvpA family protein [Christensenellales bacterium]|jgi:uncharacterized membrane protein required for colicin V production